MDTKTAGDMEKANGLSSVGATKVTESSTREEEEVDEAHKDHDDPPGTRSSPPRSIHAAVMMDSVSPLSLRAKDFQPSGDDEDVAKKEHPDTDADVVDSLQSVDFDESGAAEVVAEKSSNSYSGLPSIPEMDYSTEEENSQKQDLADDKDQSEANKIDIYVSRSQEHEKSESAHGHNDQQVKVLPVQESQPSSSQKEEALGEGGAVDNEWDGDDADSFSSAHAELPLKPVGQTTEPVHVPEEMGDTNTTESSDGECHDQVTPNSYENEGLENNHGGDSQQSPPIFPNDGRRIVELPFFNIQQQRSEDLALYAEDVLSLSLGVQTLKAQLQREIEEHQLVIQDLQREKSTRKMVEEELEQRKKEHANARAIYLQDVQQLMAECQEAKLRFRAAEQDAQEALELAEDSAQKRDEMERFLQAALDELEQLRSQAQQLPRIIESSLLFPKIGTLSEGEALLGDDDVDCSKKTRQLSYLPRDNVDRILKRKRDSFSLMFPRETEIFYQSEEEGISREVEEKEELPDLRFPLRFAPRVIRKDHTPPSEDDIEAEAGESEESEHPPIIKATRFDKIRTFILALIMATLVGVCVGWKSYASESHSLFGIVGLACHTNCSGDLELRNFFVANENNFGLGDVIALTMHLDPLNQESAESEQAVVEIVRIDKDGDNTTQTVVKKLNFGPPDRHERETFTDKVVVDWDNPENHHVINVSSENGVELSFTLAAQRQTPLSRYSVLIAALILASTYISILLEVIHRTLVSIFGSLVALFFFFSMNRWKIDSIRTIMLHQEWSTLGLLFGMMVIVGELSRTGVFEWLAVRLLLKSSSFNLLMTLLCLLTAVASAFLDNATTMLLIAPVTIDMCGILEVDPRPYLISEILLSNIGGTATLIGDPPNIIIGSALDEVGYVDFIVNVLPAIIFLVVPGSLLLLLWTFRPYMTYKQMPEREAQKLKDAYPIYDQPRLMIAGTTTFFLIVLFLLDPVHHKDTAWLALITAFITISFTNPHDVQDVLRNHIDWDTLLFFAGLFVLVEVCAAMGLMNALLEGVGNELVLVIKSQEESQQLPIAITLILWVSAIGSSILFNIPYTATMIPVIANLAEKFPDPLPIKTLAWALSFGACLGGNGTLLGASANIVTAGIAANRGYKISFMNFLFPGMATMILTTAIANLYMLIVYVWV